jgi:Cyclin, N-terminal domain/Cyclin, C-terminal domain
MPVLSLTPTTLDDAMPPDMDSIDVAERVAVMRMQEETQYRIHDYLAESVQMRKQASKPVDEDCRVRMCEWCYQVVDFCKFRRETVGIGMSYLDRFLCTQQGVNALCNRKIYQLAAMTALYIAIKIHEPLEMETSLLADLSRGCYNEMEFVAMEQNILTALHFRVNGPTPLTFIQHIMALMPRSVHHTVATIMMDYARYQIELAVSEQSFVDIRPSVVALASVLNAMEGMDSNILSIKAQAKFLRSIEKYTGLATDEVEIIQSKLSLLLVGMIDYDQAKLAIDQHMRGNESVDESSKKGDLLRRNSPKSVIRR